MEAKRIRKTNKNISRLKQADLICFPDDDSFPFGLRKYHCWAIWNEGEIIAYAAGCKFKEYYFLARAGVHPSFRGQGIQRELINKRIEMAKHQNLIGAITYTSKGNTSSIKNLEACGLECWDDPIPEFEIDGFAHWKLDFISNS